MKTVKFQMEELTCPSCIKKIEKALLKLSGVQAAQVLFNSSKVKVVYNEANIDSERIKDIIEKLGYQILTAKEKLGDD
ncbi:MULTISPECIES: heavy-metal-associated domain-containing protein [Bacillaceae]|uniref:heavy-metal-associated domain-containing protein n=1 Tax=Bacillaceae TaxID=186817 RepID=UPI001189016E|nr:heavy metal-associated domain-containing protein [Bacillus sp. S3]QCJ41830.1 heavy-metal-associated domain-containing protein [Bacillus sp. S3]